MSALTVVAITIPRSPYWHFNSRLLEDKSFLEGFSSFWAAWREVRMNYQSMRQWWDIGKVQTKLFCQQYTGLTSKYVRMKIESIEREILLIIAQGRGSGTEVLADHLNQKNLPLRCMLEERGRELW